MGVGERPDPEPKKEEGKEVVEGGQVGDARDRLCQLPTFAGKGVDDCLNQGWHVSPTTCPLHLMAGIVTRSQSQYSHQHGAAGKHYHSDIIV